MSELSQELQQWSLLHFEKGVPICDINVRKENKDRLARVSHVYWQWIKSPYLDAGALLRQLVKGKYADLASEAHAAQKDKMLFDFVVEHVSPPSRKVSEWKVRAAADKMLRIGMETDDVMALDKGSKRLIELDRLNQPESEQADVTKVMFLPPVVTTNVTDVDDTKEDVSDEQALAIINKYGAFVDPKRQMIDERVETMMARRDSANTEEAEYTESDE